MDILLIEKLGKLQGDARAAHQRLDRLELGLRDDLATLNRELKDLNAYMNKSKGWIAALMLIASVIGNVIYKLAEILIK